MRSKFFYNQINPTVDMLFCLYDCKQPEDGSNKPKHVAVIVVFTINVFDGKYMVCLKIYIIYYHSGFDLFPPSSIQTRQN
jgi:hypothetical protein